MKRCLYGKLKNPSGGRRCKKPAGQARGGRPCVHGPLKNPKGSRVCKKAPSFRRYHR